MQQFKANFHRQNGGGQTRTDADRSRGIYSQIIILNRRKPDHTASIESMP
jgi:hypothetical protein